MYAASLQSRNSSTNKADSLHRRAVEPLFKQRRCDSVKLNCFGEMSSIFALYFSNNSIAQKIEPKIRNAVASEKLVPVSSVRAGKLP